MSKAAPARAKKTGEKMMLIFLAYSLIFSTVSVLAIAIPAAKEPTIGDKPMYAANAEAPKQDAVAAASKVAVDPLDVKLIIFGRIMAEKTVMPNHNPKEVNITVAILNGFITCAVVIKDTITPKTANPNTSSTTAALIIILDSTFLVLFNS